MAGHTTAEEIEKEFASKMGGDLGRIFYALYKEVVWVHAKWQEYRKLFGTDSERIALLNRTASFFFNIVQDGIWEDVLLHISRLTDPPRSVGRDNLTIKLLPSLIQDNALRTEVEKLVAVCVERAEFAREHRNRRLAHRDLLHATEPPAAPFSGISRAHIEQMLLALRNLMNRLDGHFRDTTVAYERFITSNGAENLLSALQRAEGTHGRKNAL
ncbi:MAG: hypothetical protein IDH49_05830 [Gammaproteobacteria bacterium]|nr:hypothetical protein [Gammaproteobacteria bacterium]